MNSATMISGSGSSAAATWEEKAFAEDASGSLGCIWPPRSYSCSFCMREFRSAQALGGHMNVHRRDRARLKQCLHNSNTNNNFTAATDHLHHHRGNSNSFLGASSELDPNFSRASALSTGPEVLRSFLSPYSGTAAPPSWSTEKLVLSVSSGTAKPTEEDDGLDYVETDLSVGLINSIVSRSRHHGGENDVEAAMMSCKRPKMGASIPTGPFPFFLQHPAAAISMEDLDLELRLGDPTPPKVK